MKHSIRRQLAGVFIGLMAGTILLCWFINSTFLQRYYVHNKQNVLLEVYRELQEAVGDDGMDSETFQLRLQQSCSKYNLSLLVMDADSRPVMTFRGDEFIRQQLWQHIFMNTDETATVMKRTDQYVIQRVGDDRSRMEYIEIWGILGNGNFFLIRSALEGIRDSVQIANRFLAYVGVLGAVASGIIIWFVARRIADPILQLADISERMTHLDFEVRYHGESGNEIALLGENINKLSETLETTISELKTANNELKKDIEKKNQVDEMRREFLSNVSHELKTPIALIQDRKSVV